MRVFEPLRRLQPQHVRVLKAVLFVACLIPVMRLGWLAMHHGLGANPIFKFGTDDQKAEWLPDLVAGRALGATGTHRQPVGGPVTA